MSAPDDLFSSPPSGPTNPDNAAYSVDGKVDRWGRYRLPHPVSGRVMPWTRATTFAKSIADTYRLSLWQQRMAIKGLTMRPDLYAATAATPLEDRDALDGLVEKAKEVAGAKTAAGLGTALHSFTEAADRGEDVTPGPWSPDIAAYSAALPVHGLTVAPGMIERKIVVEQFSVAGTLDRIYRTATPCPQCDRSLCIGDLKTGATLEYGWTEIAVQLALYAHADAIWDMAVMEYERPAPLCQCNAIVVHLPVGQATATVYDVNIMEGWAAAELCAAVRRWRNVKNLAVPRTTTFVNSDMPIPTAGTGDAAVVTLPSTWEQRIDAAMTRADLSAIWREASGNGEWSPDLHARGAARLAAIAADTAGG
jgi:hypothetical protein